MQQHWRKFIFSCVSGNILELYQFIIYGCFATLIGKLFFPHQNQYSSLLTIFGVFATGCIVRPFGAILLGYLGDKLGRRLSLIISIGSMTISTLAIGLLPTYSQIGIMAPALLIFFRIGQGLSMTSEEIGAALFLMENAPHNEKGYASSFILASVYIGLFLGSLVSTLLFSLLSNHSLLAGGWRIPFLVGGIIGFLTLILRIKQPESYEFHQILASDSVSKNPFIDLLKAHKASVLRTTLLCSLFSVAVYLFAVYVPNIMNTWRAEKHLTMLVCSGEFLLTFFISLATGKLVDKIGSTLPILTSTIGFIVLSYPIFYLLSNKTWPSMIFAYGLFASLLGITAGSIMYEITKYFAVNIRFSGSCISFNLSMSLFGGTAPMLALYLTKIMSQPTSPALLLITAATITLIALYIVNAKTKEKTYGHQVRYQNR